TRSSGAGGDRGLAAGAQRRTARRSHHQLQQLRRDPQHRAAALPGLPSAVRNNFRADPDRHYGRGGAGKEGELMVPLSWYLILSAILFSLGVFGFLLKRNIITIFMSIELMLNAVNLSFVAFANYWHSHPAKLASGVDVVPLSGHVFVFFVMVVAAAEA